MSVITENNKDHLLNYEGVEQLLVKINDRFARTDRYATQDTLGMIRAEINTDVTSEDIYTGDNHPVQITTDGNAFVNIDIPTSLPANGGNADTVDGKHASDFATAGHTHNRFTSDLVHFDGAIHICNRSGYEYDDESGEEYEHVPGIYFSDNVEDSIADDAYTFIREEGDDRLRVHSNYELKLSTGGAAQGNYTDNISGPNIRIISNPDDDNGEDETLEHTIQMHAGNGVFVNGSEVAVKSDIPSALKNPHALTIQKNGKTLTNGVYDGSAAKTVNIITNTLNGTTLINDATKRNLTTHPTTTNAFVGGWGSETDTLGFNTRYGTTLDLSYSTWYQRLAFNTSESNGKRRIEYFSGINTNNGDGTEATLTKIGDLAYLSDIPSALKNPHALTIQGNGTTIGSYDGSSTKTINITPASIGADTKPFSTVRDFADGTLIKTNIDYSVTNGAPFYVEIKGNTYFNIGSMFIQAQGYIYNDTITNYSVTSLGKIYPEQFIAINVDGNLCFWFPRIGYWHGYSVKVTTGYDYSVNCVTDVINSVEPTGTKRVVLSNNYFINHGFDGGSGGVSINPAGNYLRPVYINGNNEAQPVEGIEDTLVRWKHPDQTNQGTDLLSLFSPIDTAVSQLHSANRLAFGNPDGITVEYSTDGGTTWVDYGLTNAQKINLISNQSYGTDIRAGKALSTRVTANDKLRITINASMVGFYTSARALYINFSTQGAENCTLDVERANRGSETNFTTWKTGLILNGWSGWNKLPLGGIAFGGDNNQTSNVGAIRLTFSCSGANPSYTGNCYFSVYDLQLVGDTAWTTCSNMGKTGHLYDYDNNQNAIFPASVTATNDIYGKVIHVEGSANNTTGYIGSDANYNMFISQNGVVPFVVDCSNTGAPSIRAGYSHVNTVSLGTSTVPFKNVYAGGFTKKDSSDNYVLLGGGGHKAISDFAVANHNHTINLTGTFTPNITSSYNNGVLTISAATTNVEYTGTTDVENTNANPESWFVDPDDMTAFFANEVSTTSTLEGSLNLYMTGE